MWKERKVHVLTVSPSRQASWRRRDVREWENQAFRWPAIRSRLISSPRVVVGPRTASQARAIPTALGPRGLGLAFSKERSHG